MTRALQGEGAANRRAGMPPRVRGLALTSLALCPCVPAGEREDGRMARAPRATMTFSCSEAGIELSPAALPQDVAQSGGHHQEQASFFLELLKRDAAYGNTSSGGCSTPPQPARARPCARLTGAAQTPGPAKPYSYRPSAHRGFFLRKPGLERTTRHKKRQRKTEISLAVYSSNRAST